MKTIKLFLLLTFGLWADFKLDIPNDINVSLLENIVENGWDESNETLNKFIVSNAERVMPEIMEKIKKPVLRGIVINDGFPPMPKLLLNKYDYLHLLAYCKYLEANSRIDEALEVNIQILKGLKNIEDKSMLSVIFSFVVERLVREGLVQVLSKDKYTEEKRETILLVTQELFTLDTSAFFVAMQKEKEALLNLDLMRDSKEKYIAQEVGGNYNFLMEDIQRYMEIYQNNLYNKMFDAMKKETAEGIQVHEEEMRRIRKEHSSTINYVHFAASSLWIKIRSLVGIEIKDFGYVSQYLAHNLVYVATPKINETYTDYLKHIQENKIFLKQLKN